MALARGLQIVPPSVEVSSYGPELLELFRRAAQNRQTILLSTIKSARNARLRLNNLRGALRHQQHPMRDVANSVQVRLIEHDNGQATLIAEPSDTEIIDALRRANITIEIPDSPNPHADNPDEPYDAIDEFLTKTRE